MGEPKYKFHCGPGKGQGVRGQLAEWDAKSGGIQVWECNALDSAMLGVPKFTPVGGKQDDWKYAEKEVVRAADIEVVEEMLSVLPVKPVARDKREVGAASARMEALRKHVAAVQLVQINLNGTLHSAVEFRRAGGQDRGLEYEVVGLAGHPKHLHRFSDDGPDYYLCTWGPAFFMLSPWAVPDGSLIDDHEKARRLRLRATVEPHK